MTRPLAVLACSGGMDSTTLVGHYAATHDLLLLSFNYGQRHSRELESARKVAQFYGVEHEVIDLTSVGRLLSGSALTDPGVPVPEGHYAEDSMRATVVPNRNAIFASIMIGVASARGAELVGLGVHAGDHFVYPDCRPRFIEALVTLELIALEGFNTPEIHAPFMHWTKADIATHAAEIGAPLHLSWSCYAGGDIHCGRCGTCTERAEAFHLAGVTDPTEYESPDFWLTVQQEVS
jgi:7-cyano-7-deazaguanine synthase